VTTPALTGRVLARRLAVPIVLVLGVSIAHGVQARRAGESIAPVVLAAAMGLGIVVGVFYFVAARREGALPAGDPEAIQVRRARLLRWVIPLWILCAVLAALGKLLSTP
jgi:hypothetical protein